MQLVLSLTPGGTERLVIEIVRALRDRVDSIVCCLDAPGAWAAELEAISVPVISLRREAGFRPELAIRLARIMKAHEIDVVHCHHYSPYVYGLLASMLRPGVQLVFTEHGKLSNHGPSRKRRLVNPLLSRWPAHVCAVSLDLKQHMVEEGFPAKKIDVLYNGIDPGRRPTASDCRAMRAQLGLSESAFVVGSAGRLVAVKNLELLLRAHALVVEKHPQARAVIVGDGPERERLEVLTRELRIDDSVLFTGYRGDVRHVMAAFDLYANTSRFEGVSLTILEAMATALPVVATPVGGNPEVVIDQETGVLAPAGVRSFAAVVSRLLLDPRSRRRMGDAGRLRVIRHFSISRMVDDYSRAYFGPRHRAMTAAPAAAPIVAETMSVIDATRSTV